MPRTRRRRLQRQRKRHGIIPRVQPPARYVVTVARGAALELLRVELAKRRDALLVLPKGFTVKLKAIKRMTQKMNAR